MSADQVINIFKNFGIFQVTDWFNDGIRHVFFKIFYGAFLLAKGAQKVIVDIISLKFFNFEDVKTLFSNLFDVRIALIILSLTIFALIVILGKEKKLLDKFISIIIAIVFVLSLSVFMDMASNISDLFKEDLFKTNTEALDKVFLSNFYDLRKFDNDNFAVRPSSKYNNNLSIDKVKFININERMRDPKNTAVLHYRYNGYDLEELSYSNTFLPDIFDQLYYRWYITFFSGTIYFVFISLVYLLLSIKCGIIIYELALYKVFGGVLMSAFVSVPQKVFLILKHIFKAYVHYIFILFTLIIYNYFILYIKYIEKGFFVEIILLIAVSYTVIKGDNFLNSVFGIQNQSSSVLLRLLGIQGLRSATKGLKTGVSSMFGNKTNNTSKPAVSSSDGKVSNEASSWAGQSHTRTNTSNKSHSSNRTNNTNAERFNNTDVSANSQSWAGETKTNTSDRSKSSNESSSGGKGKDTNVNTAGQNWASESYQKSNSDKKTKAPDIKNKNPDSVKSYNNFDERDKNQSENWANKEGKGNS